MGKAGRIAKEKKRDKKKKKNEGSTSQAPNANRSREVFTLNIANPNPNVEGLLSNIPEQTTNFSIDDPFKQEDSGNTDLMLKLEKGVAHHLFLVMYDEAIEFLKNEKSILPENSNADLGLIEEYFCLVHHTQAKKERALEHAMEAWELYKRDNLVSAIDLFRLVETCLILGDRFVELGQLGPDQFDLPQLQLSYNFVCQGLKIKPELVPLVQLKARVSDLKSKAWTAQLLAEDSAEKAQAAANAANKKQASDSKGAADKKKTADEEVAEPTTGEEPATEEEPGASAEEVVKKGKKAEEEMGAGASIKKFTDYFTIQMRQDGQTWKGSMSNKFGEFSRTFIDYDIGKQGEYNRLWELCSSHEGLLSVAIFTSFSSSESATSSSCESASSDCPLFVTEEVSTFQDYCEQLVNEYLKRPNEGRTWWDFIRKRFFRIFRDVIITLTFLYTKKDRCCGNLKRGLYVTNYGRARILPALAGGKMANDVNDFVWLMKTFLFHPSIKDSVDNELPADLLHCLTFLPKHKMMPLQYLLNHPFFWTYAEMIDYPTRLKNIIYLPGQDLGFSRDVLNEFLVRRPGFKDWGKKLVRGIYHEIWKKGDPAMQEIQIPLRKLFKSVSAVTVAPYKDRVSLVRYFAAALFHYFDNEYDSLRPTKMTRSDVLEELIMIFPEFYTTMYESVVLLLEEGSIDLRVLSEFATMVEEPNIDQEFTQAQTFTAPTTVPTSSTAPQAKAQTPTAPTTVPTSSTAPQARGEANVYGQAASNLVAGIGSDAAIQQILNMDGGSWDKDTVRHLLRAAFNDPDKAIECLYFGIPEQAEVSPVARAPTASPAGGQAADLPAQVPQGALLSGGPNASHLDLFPETATGSGDGSGDVTAPATIAPQSAASQLAASQLAASFLTPQERMFVDRIVGMGFGFDGVLQTFLNANKNQQMTEEFILHHPEDFARP